MIRSFPFVATADLMLVAAHFEDMLNGQAIVYWDQALLMLGESRARNSISEELVLIRAELRRRAIFEFEEQHDCGPEAEWDDVLRVLFAVQFPALMQP